MYRLARTVFICVGLAFLLGSSASAQKFGFIDSEKIQTGFKEWAKAQDQFSTEYKAWDDEASRMNQELQDMIAEYQKQQLILSAEKKAEREAAINAKQQALESFTRDINGPGGRAEKRMKELAAPLQEKIQMTIEKIAIERNLDFVFNSASLAYSKKELDITDAVLEALESGN